MPARLIVSFMLLLAAMTAEGQNPQSLTNVLYVQGGVRDQMMDVYWASPASKTTGIVPGRHMSGIADIGKPNDPAFSAIKSFIANPLAGAQSN